MVINDKIRKAYSEVDEFIELLSNNVKQKIPQNLKQIFKEEKDKEYVKNIKADIPIIEQDLLEETLAIIAMLNLNYICEDEKEKERLRKIYENNEKKYQDIFQVDFNADEVFGIKQEDYSSNQKEQIIILQKETIFQKIIKKIKRLFRKN